MTRRRRDEEYVVASDNLPARRNGAWARDKLSFLDEYLPPALQATIAKRQRYYLDLFAGPGLNVDDDGQEFEGAAIRRARVHRAFSPSSVPARERREAQRGSSLSPVCRRRG
jgi:hypothetical protein